MFHVPEEKRIKNGSMPSAEIDGNNGAFVIRMDFRDFLIIASDGMGWEHVSVSTANRCPKWEEMCLIKDIFWDEEDCVIEYHPAKSEYVNNHPHTLHLWRPIATEIPKPPSILVGIIDKK